MSNSTIFFRGPEIYRQKLAKIRDKYRQLPPAVSFILWTFSVLYSAAKTTLNPTVSGVTLSFPLLDVVLFAWATYALKKGFIKKSVAWTIPWLFLTIASIYLNHYKGLVAAIETITVVRKLSWLPWTTFALNTVLLIIRLTLLVRVVQLCINMWFKTTLDQFQKKQ